MAFWGVVSRILDECPVAYRQAPTGPCPVGGSARCEDRVVPVLSARARSTVRYEVPGSSSGGFRAMP